MLVMPTLWATFMLPPMRDAHAIDCLSQLEGMGVRLMKTKRTASSHRCCSPQDCRRAPSHVGRWYRVPVRIARLQHDPSAALELRSCCGSSYADDGMDEAGFISTAALRARPKEAFPEPIPCAAAAAQQTSQQTRRQADPRNDRSQHRKSPKTAKCPIREAAVSASLSQKLFKKNALIPMKGRVVPIPRICFTDSIGNLPTSSDIGDRLHHRKKRNAPQL